MHIFADCCKGYGIEVYSSTNQSLANISDIYGIFEKHGYENDGKQYYQHPSKNLYIKFCYDTQWIITHGDDSDVCYYWDYFNEGYNIVLFPPFELRISLLERKYFLDQIWAGWF